MNSIQASPAVLQARRGDWGQQEGVLFRVRDEYTSDVNIINALSCFSLKHLYELLACIVLAALLRVLQYLI